ncbi:MAG: hypothetical protein AAF126_26480, partial [Chloroflexota bacterium]
MPKITVHASIGPSPRKQFLLEWHTAQAEENFDFLSDNVMDEIVLQVVGKKIVIGRAHGRYSFAFSGGNARYHFCY